MAWQLILDAMGVIYRAGDDIQELLIPYVRNYGGEQDAERIAVAYLRASLGQIAAEEFCQQVDLPATLEDDYLEQHALSDGLSEFLEIAFQRFDVIACLSNDVSEWSKKLRNRFSLGRHISQWYISGDLKLRKPSPVIYNIVLDAMGGDPQETVFVDDQPRNLIPAAELGIKTICLSPRGAADSRIPSTAKDFPGILSILTSETMRH